MNHQINSSHRTVSFQAYYRRAAAHMSLGKFKLALSDFELVSKRRPNDIDAKKKFTECSKIVKKMAFERAIAVDRPEKTLAEMYQSLDSISIEDDYDGPKLEDEKTVTLEFMKGLMQHYKDQKKLHKKYAYKVRLVDEMREGKILEREKLREFLWNSLNFEKISQFFPQKKILRNLTFFKQFQILYDMDAFLRKQPSLVDVKIPDDGKFTVCGDIHGQFYDLMNIFEKNGLPSETNPYLFNGDFVDRGSFSVECIFTLFGFKLLFPNHFFMSRGKRGA